MTVVVARGLSTLGHPVIVMPAAVLLPAMAAWFLVRRIAALVATSICWSRVFLGRHIVAEVAGRSVLGAAMGACLWLAQ